MRNPDQYIGTVGKGGKLKVELRLQKGRGYRGAEFNKEDDLRKFTINMHYVTKVDPYTVLLMAQLQMRSELSNRHIFYYYLPKKLESLVNQLGWGKYLRMLPPLDARDVIPYLMRQGRERKETPHIPHFVTTEGTLASKNGVKQVFVIDFTEKGVGLTCKEFVERGDYLLHAKIEYPNKTEPEVIEQKIEITFCRETEFGFETGPVSGET